MRGVRFSGIDQSRVRLVEHPVAVVEAPLRPTPHGLLGGEVLVGETGRGHRGRVVADAFTAGRGKVETTRLDDELNSRLLFDLTPGRVGVRGQRRVGGIVVGEADDAGVVLRGAVVVAEPELLQRQHLASGLARQAVGSRATETAATDDDVLVGVFHESIALIRLPSPRRRERGSLAAITPP